MLGFISIEFRKGMRLPSRSNNNNINIMKASYMRKLLDNQLSEVLASTQCDSFAFEELYVIMYEANIKFDTPEQIPRLKQMLKDCSISLREIYKLFTPVRYEIVHNKPLLYLW